MSKRRTGGRVFRYSAWDAVPALLVYAHLAAEPGGAEAPVIRLAHFLGFLELRTWRTSVASGRDPAPTS